MKKFIVLEMKDERTASNLYDFDTLDEANNKRNELLSRDKNVSNVLENGIRDLRNE